MAALKYSIHPRHTHNYSDTVTMVTRRHHAQFNRNEQEPYYTFTFLHFFHNFPFFSFFVMHNNKPGATAALVSILHFYFLVLFALCSVFSFHFDAVFRVCFFFLLHFFLFCVCRFRSTLAFPFDYSFSTPVLRSL